MENIYFLLLANETNLGVVLEERSLFPKNEQNYQDQSHRSEQRMERKVIKNIVTEGIRTERNRY